MSIATDASRPDPDALLARVQADARRQRASLKIFFGAAPGVGKTYAMLEAAHRLRAAGVDVAVGVVETHGRAETDALCAGLEVLPRHHVEHRGVVIDELDLERALDRHPTVLLVDELAHHNAPGSRHLKRWQDVMELLDAGIDVYTTLNVQHLDSLGDVVQQITGVKVRETVPDRVLERADELELIDLPPEALLARLGAGKVYLGDQAGRAAQHFFQRGNLLALRELALRRTAEHVDAEVQAYRRAHGIEQPWQAGERLLVCVGASPSSARLIRAGKRAATRLGAQWLVVTVETVGAAPPGDADRDRLEQHLRLAEALGAEVVRLHGATIAGAILECARQRGVTRILAGKPTHSRWRDRVRGSLLDELIRGSGGLDVHVIAPLDLADAAPGAGAAAGEGTRPRATAYVGAAAGIAATTALCLALFDYLSAADIAMLYLITIMVAALSGRGPSLLASSLAVAAFDVCFVPPRFTFVVAEGRFLLTFVVMFGSGLAISTLTLRLRRAERDALVRERRTAALLAFTRDVALAGGVDEIAAVAVRHVEELLGVAAALLVPDAAGALQPAAGLMPLAAQEVAVAAWTHAHGQPSGHGTQTLPGAHIVATPLRSGDRALGVLVCQARRGARPLDADQRHLLATIAGQAALALGQAQLAAEARDATLRARTEELRSSLLSAVSHDLRTPLAVITGAATSLRDDADALTAATRAELLATIVDEAQRLERVLQNLLGITRVETGLEPAREWVPVDELVGAALGRLDDVLGDRVVEVDAAADLLVPVDPVLFEQVLINLVENAVKHGASPLRLAARRLADAVEIEVRDHGAGLPAGAAGRVFDKFYRAPGTRSTGVGLGLAVCRGIVQAHGGTIVAEDAPGGGACFRITLPASAPPVDLGDDAAVVAPGAAAAAEARP